VAEKEDKTPKPPDTVLGKLDQKVFETVKRLDVYEKATELAQKLHGASAGGVSPLAATRSQINDEEQLHQGLTKVVLELKSTYGILKDNLGQMGNSEENVKLERLLRIIERQEKTGEKITNREYVTKEEAQDLIDALDDMSEKVGDFEDELTVNISTMAKSLQSVVNNPKVARETKEEYVKGFQNFLRESKSNRGNKNIKDALAIDPKSLEGMTKILKNIAEDKLKPIKSDIKKLDASFGGAIATADDIKDLLDKQTGEGIGKKSFRQKFLQNPEIYSKGEEMSKSAIGGLIHSTGLGMLDEMFNITDTVTNQLAQIGKKEIKFPFAKQSKVPTTPVTVETAAKTITPAATVKSEGEALASEKVGTPLPLGVSTEKTVGEALASEKVKAESITPEQKGLKDVDVQLEANQKETDKKLDKLIDIEKDLKPSLMDKLEGFGGQTMGMGKNLLGMGGKALGGVSSMLGGGGGALAGAGSLAAVGATAYGGAKLGGWISDKMTENDVGGGKLYDMLHPKDEGLTESQKVIADKYGYKGNNADELTKFLQDKNKARMDETKPAETVTPAATADDKVLLHLPTVTPPVVTPSAPISPVAPIAQTAQDRAGITPATAAPIVPATTVTPSAVAAPRADTADIIQKINACCAFSLEARDIQQKLMDRMAKLGPSFAAMAANASTARQNKTVDKSTKVDEITLAVMNSGKY
jgi:hypothetical protein